ncbi:MAG: response regulator transcription factor [Bacteroidaceae bacterium]|nr:response regulator transcription factor [Bacteroidaceae bacterium]
MKKIKILLVDDDVRNSMFLKKFLEVEDYEVTYANNGRVAWELYPSVRPDLVLLDVNMPEMDGFELAQLIRQQDHQVLIFFLTDRTEKVDRLMGFHLKGNDYIPKPFYPEELIAKIKERFEHKTSEQPSRFMIGETLFDTNLSIVEYNGMQQHLSVRQTEILTILSENFGKVVERDTILKRVWGNVSYANSLALNVQISYLRHILQSDATLTLSSLKKRGYILMKKTDR